MIPFEHAKSLTGNKPYDVNVELEKEKAGFLLKLEENRDRWSKLFERQIDYLILCATDRNESKICVHDYAMSSYSCLVNRIRCGFKYGCYFNTVEKEFFNALENEVLDKYRESGYTVEVYNCTMKSYGISWEGKNV